MKSSVKSERQRELSYMPKTDSNIKEFLQSKSRLDRDNQTLRVIEQVRKPQSVQGFIEKERKKLPSLKESWSNTRDISHLRDTRDPRLSPTVFSLPTEMTTLTKMLDLVDFSEKQRERLRNRNFTPIYCMKDQCFERCFHVKDVKADSLEAVYLGNPTGRQDIENLTKWYRLMKLKYITQYRTHNDEHLDNCSRIYSLCIREIIRQVSVFCVERGKLLKEIVKKTEMLHHKSQDKALDDLRKNKAELEAEIAVVKMKSEEASESHDSAIIELYEKVSACVYELNESRVALKDTLYEFEILKEQYINLKQKYYQKDKALNILNRQLNSKGISVKKQLIKQAVTLPTLTPDDPQPDDPQPERDISAILSESRDFICETVDNSTQTEQFPCHKHPRYSIAPPVVPLKRTGSFSTVPLPSGIVESYHSTSSVPQYFPEFPELSPEKLLNPSTSPPMTFPASPVHSEYLADMNACEIFHAIETELKQYVPEDVDYESWKAGVITGLEKGRALGLEEPTESPEPDSVPQPRIRRLNTFVSRKDYRMNRPSVDGISEISSSEDSQHSAYKRPGSQELFRSTTSKPDEKNPHRKWGEPKPLARKPILKLLSRKKTKFMEFNWHRKREQHAAPKKVQGGATLISALTNKSLDWLLKRGLMSKKIVHKMISSIYWVAVSKEHSSLVEVTYDEFLKRYGLKKVAEKKLTEFFASCFKYKTTRMLMFLRFQGLAEKLALPSYSKYSFTLFLAAYNFMVKSKVGITIYIDESLEDLLLPVIRATECVREKAEKLIDRAALSAILNWAEATSVPDAKKINPGGLIPLDRFLKRLVDSYESYQHSIYEGLFVLFEAMMVESECISDIEFEIMIRFIHPKEEEALEDFSTPRSPHSPKAESYTFEQAFARCLSLHILSIPDIRKTLAASARSPEDMNEQRPELDKILGALSATELSIRTLDSDVLSLRLDLLQDSYYELKKEIVSLGWSIYSAELQRLKVEYFS